MCVERVPSENVEIPLSFCGYFVAAFLFLFPFSVRVDASHPRSFVLDKFLTVLNVSDVEVSNENGHLPSSMSIVFQHSHRDTGSPFGQRACDCSASGTGFAL